MKKRILLSVCLILLGPRTFAQHTVNAQDSLLFQRIFHLSLTQGHAYPLLGELCKTIGARLSGSEQADKAVIWAYDKFKSYGFDRVDTMGVLVPHWVRGQKQIVRVNSEYLQKMLAKDDTRKALISDIAKSTYTHSPAAEYECESYLETHPKPSPWMTLPAATLGGSIGGKVEASVVSITSKNQLDSLGKAGALKGKIVLLNRPMDEAELNTFHAYGDCARQRVLGSNWCSPHGALAVLVRSVSNRCDLHPHTGSVYYAKDITPIPLIAVATGAADMLHYLSLKDPSMKVAIELDCQMLPDKWSANVIAQTNGSVYPDKIIAFGGHFDSWDIGEGAHDDGAGCMHAFEALRILKAIGYTPRHTLRCVFWMNEENGARGAAEYARRCSANKETHIAAIESDRGGFTPRGFGVDSALLQLVKVYEPLLRQYGISDLEKGGGGVDIAPLRNVFKAIQLVSLNPDSQRYFDVHHAETDVFENINKRELELGAAAMAVIIYIIDQNMD